MISARTFRPLVFVAAVATFMLLASTSVEAIPPQAPPALSSNPLTCVECPNPPECDYRFCRYGYYCESNWCTCTIHCREGDIP
ncbi:MAG: hypothetical protein J3R72DRAFT_447213 [Linnemannia gamsii]|nr:MAG: hypothetical protein J3R72DRAFT_447213 [Linnemannia gamsii]